RIALALRLVAARFGPDVVRRLAGARPRPDERAVPSGSLGLDLATGLGGLPRGHVTELLGAPSSGKTALLAAALAAAQRAGGLARGRRVLTAALADGPTAVVVTNELLPRHPGYRTPGGLALRHFAALRVAVEPRALLPGGTGDIRALRAELVVVKHKLGAPG